MREEPHWVWMWWRPCGDRDGVVDVLRARCSRASIRRFNRVRVWQNRPCASEVSKASGVPFHLSSTAGTLRSSALSIFWGWRSPRRSEMRLWIFWSTVHSKRAILVILARCSPTSCWCEDSSSFTRSASCWSWYFAARASASSLSRRHVSNAAAAFRSLSSADSRFLRHCSSSAETRLCTSRSCKSCLWRCSAWAFSLSSSACFSVFVKAASFSYLRMVSFCCRWMAWRLATSPPRSSNLRDSTAYSVESLSFSAWSRWMVSVLERASLISCTRSASKSRTRWLDTCRSCSDLVSWSRSTFSTDVVSRSLCATSS
eukprot:Sspe_Gene.54974::Locus_30287_Transcript_1_1_Confidence_1.000_Length_3791::g.54974::m.54974